MKFLNVAKRIESEIDFLSLLIILAFNNPKQRVNQSVSYSSTSIYIVYVEAEFVISLEVFVPSPGTEIAIF